MRSSRPSSTSSSKAESVSRSSAVAVQKRRQSGGCFTSGCRFIHVLSATEPFHKAGHGPHWHLVAVGARSEWRGQGLGSARVEAAGVPCHLETWTQPDIKFHAKRGFEVVGQSGLDGPRPHRHGPPARGPTRRRPDPASRTSRTTMPFPARPDTGRTRPAARPTPPRPQTATPGRQTMDRKYKASKLSGTRMKVLALFSRDRMRMHFGGDFSIPSSQSSR